MLPGFRFLFATVVLSVSVLVSGNVAAASSTTSGASVPRCR